MSGAPDKPKIFVFSNVRGGDEGMCYAIAEDGECLGGHWCSHESFALIDLGVTPGRRLDRHETYAKHYPDGYEMEFVRGRDIEGHEALQLTLELNRKQIESSGGES